MQKGPQADARAGPGLCFGEAAPGFGAGPFERFFGRPYEDGRALQLEYVSARFNLLTERYRVIRKRHYEEGRSTAWIARRHRVPEDAAFVPRRGRPNSS